MVSFYDIVERWAELYIPMQHDHMDPKRNRRFYLTDTYMGMVDFMTNIQPDRSPCVVMESNQSGRIDDKMDHIEYTIYFMVRAKDMSDGRSALRAKQEAHEHMMKFLVWAREEIGNQFGIDVRIYNLDEQREYNTAGPFYDGWYGVYTTIEEINHYNRCVNHSDYIQ